MPSPNKYLIAIFFALATVAAACTSGSGGDNANTTSAPTDSGSATTQPGAATTTAGQATTTTTASRATQIVYTVDPDTGEPIETEIEDPPPNAYLDLVAEGVTSGAWDEAEGVRLTLGYNVGAIGPDEIPGIEDVIARDFTDVLDRAGELLDAGDNDPDLERWYRLARPSPDDIETLTAGAGTIEALSPTAVRTALRTQAGSCDAIDPYDFSDWGTFDECYLKIEDTVGGATLRVLYPKWYLDKDRTKELPNRTLEAMRRSAQTYSAYADVGDVTTIFSIASSTGERADAVATDGPFEIDASGNTVYPAGCPITVFPSSAGETFEQTVAHEMWHCTQEYTGYPDSVAGWIREGGAEYFSNVVYPGINDEWRTLKAFDVRSRTKPIYSASYSAWIWWQFLANETSTATVAALNETMARSGGRTELEQYAELFQKFTVWYVAGQIADASGGLIPPGQTFNTPKSDVGKADEGSKFEFKTDPFVAARYLVSYGEQLRFFQSAETETGGPIAMVPENDRLVLGMWSAAIPEIRSKCDKEAVYVLVSTAGGNGQKATLTIDRIEEAVCDPCVLGTWAIDLDTFEQAIMNASGGSLPAGATLDITGEYLYELDDEGKMQELRDGLTITASIGGNSIALTIDAYAKGEYTADGKNFGVQNIQELSNVVTANVPGLGGMAFPQEPAFDSGASGPYVCNKEQMTVTMPGFSPIVLDRVDKILEPPPLEVP